MAKKKSEILQTTADGTSIPVSGTGLVKTAVPETETTKTTTPTIVPKGGSSLTKTEAPKATTETTVPSVVPKNGSSLTKTRETVSAVTPKDPGGNTTAAKPITAATETTKTTTPTIVPKGGSKLTKTSDALSSQYAGDTDETDNIASGTTAATPAKTGYTEIIDNADNTARTVALTPIVLTSEDGRQYSISTEKGQNWIKTAKAGETVTQSDGSVWTKNADGTVTVTHKGVTFTMGAGSAEPSAENTTVETAPATSYTEAVGTGETAPSQYESLMNERLQKMENAKFEFDLESDPSWKSLKKQYTRNGTRAMQDTLGAASANTGGRASSYAITAANQSYGTYMAELSDRIPTIYENAYSRYLQEFEQDAQMLETYRTLLADEAAKEQSAYEREIAAQEREDALKQQAIENAISATEKVGYVTEENSVILGIPAGTKTTDAAYKEGLLAIDQAQLSENARQADNELGYKYSSLSENARQADNENSLKMAELLASESAETTNKYTDVNALMDNAGITTEAGAKQWLLANGYATKDTMQVMADAYMEYLQKEVGGTETEKAAAAPSYSIDAIIQALLKIPEKNRAEALNGLEQEGVSKADIAKIKAVLGY